MLLIAIENKKLKISIPTILKISSIINVKRQDEWIKCFGFKINNWFLKLETIWISIQNAFQCIENKIPNVTNILIKKYTWKKWRDSRKF